MDYKELITTLEKAIASNAQTRAAIADSINGIGHSNYLLLSRMYDLTHEIESNLMSEISTVKLLQDDYMNPVSPILRDINGMAICKGNTVLWHKSKFSMNNKEYIVSDITSRIIISDMYRDYEANPEDLEVI